MELREKIDLLCRREGISVSKLERDLGFGVGTIIKWGVNGRKPRLRSLDAVAKYFNVPVSAIADDAANLPEMEALGEEAKILLNAFKSAPDNVQEAIRKLLGLP